MILHAPKNGFFYVLDAKTGKLVSAEKFAPNTGRRASTRRPAARLRCPKRASTRPASPRSSHPQRLAWHNWHPMAYSPKTGLVYLPVTMSSSTYATPGQVRTQPQWLEYRHRLQRRKGRDAGRRHGRSSQIRNLPLGVGPDQGEGSQRIPNAVAGATGVMVTDGNLLFSGQPQWRIRGL